MSERLRELKHRRLFSEDCSQAMREDEWSYPKGIMLAPMGNANPDLRAQADQYFSAAVAVTELTISNRVPDYTVQVPIMFLYRHSVELYLKILIKQQDGELNRGHSLHVLLNATKGLPVWAQKRITELNAIDPDSTMLRYGGVPEHLVECWAEMTFFRDAMRLLRDLFVEMLDGRRADLRWLAHDDDN